MVVYPPFVQLYMVSNREREASQTLAGLLWFVGRALAEDELQTNPFNPNFRSVFLVQPKVSSVEDVIQSKPYKTQPRSVLNQTLSGPG